jgi:hypothetical protein
MEPAVFAKYEMQYVGPGIVGEGKGFFA